MEDHYHPQSISVHGCLRSNIKKTSKPGRLWQEYLVVILYLCHFSSANAFASVIEYWVKQKQQREIEVSRLFLYYNGRREQYQNRSVHDSGTSLKHIGDAVVRHGFCEEKVWPYRVDWVNQKPSREAYEQAKKYTIVPVRMQVNLQNIKTALANRLPVMTGILLPYSAGKDAARNHGRISKPNLNTANAQTLKKHAVVCVGFDEHKQHLIIRNSWGKEWASVIVDFLFPGFKFHFRAFMDIATCRMTTFRNHVSLIVEVVHGHYAISGHANSEYHPCSVCTWCLNMTNMLQLTRI